MMEFIIGELPQGRLIGSMFYLLILVNVILTSVILLLGLRIVSLRGRIEELEEALGAGHDEEAATEADASVAVPETPTVHY